jgi:HTH-type transcriptional regulator/antitoxin MqsA
MDALSQLLSEAKVRQRLPEPQICRLLRVRAGLTQEDVARVLGVNRAALARWELGQRTPRGQLCSDYVRLLERLAREEVAA